MARAGGYVGPVGRDYIGINSWQSLGGNRYYFNPATGRSLRWEQKIDGSWYYFNGQSQMQTGWITWRADATKSYFGPYGRALTGWCYRQCIFHHLHQ